MTPRQELQPLWDKYEKIHAVYLDARAELVERAEKEAEATDLYAASCKAYQAYREARKRQLCENRHPT